MNQVKNFWKNYKDYYGSIIRLGIPILIGQLGMIVVAFADNIMVGRYSTEALASASFVNNVFNVANFACMGFTYGLTPLIGALFTQKRFDTIGAMIRTGVWLNIAFTLLVTAVMTLVWLNLDRMGQPEELLPLIRPYYLIVLAGLLPISLFNVFAQWLFAINRTRLPMWIVLGANAVNIIGNYVFIYGNWGMPELRTYGGGSKHPYGAHNMSAYRNRHILFQKRVQRIFPRIPPWENDTPHGSSGQPHVVAGIHADDIRIGLIYICSGDGRMAGRDIACGISDYCHNRYSRFLHLL